MDHYGILGLAHSATVEEVKKAYRRLAMEWHPDRNPGDDTAEKRFREVQESYEVLSDPLRRSEYDRKGYVGRRSNATRQPKKPDPPHHKRAEKPNRTVPADVLTCTYFGGGQTGRNVLAWLKLSEAEMQSGCSKLVKILRHGLCRRCVGDARTMAACPACRGRRPFADFCVRCEGTGAIETVCPICKGKGLHNVPEEHTVPVTVPAGVRVGHAVTVLGEGESAPQKAPGYVRFVVTG